jgi:hypothetical protein
MRPFPNGRNFYFSLINCDDDDDDDGEVGGMSGFVRRTEVLGENIPRPHFVHHKSHLQDPGGNPGRRGGKPATNRFSYGAAES